MFLVKSSGLIFLNSCHSVTIMQQSASFRQLMGEVLYWILFLKIFFALGMATGSYAVIFAPLVSSWFIMGMDLASRMSSVSGLKDNPSIAIFLSANSPSAFSIRSIVWLICCWFTFWTDCSSVGL